MLKFHGEFGVYTFTAAAISGRFYKEWYVQENYQGTMSYKIVFASVISAYVVIASDQNPMEISMTLSAIIEES